VLAATSTGCATGGGAPPPRVALGILRACTQLGAVAERVAIDKRQGATREQVYREYQAMMQRSDSIVRSAHFAIGLGFDLDLQPDTLQQLATQICVVTYQGFADEAHYRSLYESAERCESESSQRPDSEEALSMCMGRAYRELVRG